MSEEMAKDEHPHTIEVAMAATPEAIYRAWTERFDTWFAAPGRISMDARVGQPYWFEVVHNGMHHPHYGRFLVLEPGHLIEQTWVTGAHGTDGAETVVRIELTADPSGAQLVLTHKGFFTASAAQQHADSWPAILHHLDQVLTAPSA
jgi:uncharacterized protein YndB with AHSA1/START domain